MHITTTERLPRLAWVVTRVGNTLEAEVGRDVLTGDGWFYEGGWASTDHPRDASRTGVYLGSGVTATGRGGFKLIGPSHTCEAVYTIATRSGIVASNSLFLALVTSGVAAEDVDLGALTRSLWTLRKGMAEYERHVAEIGERQVYRHVNAVVEVRPDGSLHEERYVDPAAVDTYERYLSFLTDVLRSVESTAGTTRRVVPLSRGYDSVACASLMKRLGGGLSLSVPTSRDGEEDDGTEIGRLLGLETRAIARPQRQFTTRKVPYSMHGGVERLERISLEEVPDLADYYAGMGLSDEVLRLEEDVARDSLLLTGFHGDRAWGLHPATPHIVRGDVSGTGLVERRLRVGFVHVPVPMIGAQSHAALRQVTTSRVMRPWRVGGEYDRPVPRRMAEEMGVPRGAFGRKKAAIATMINNQAEVAPALFEYNLGRYLPD